MNNAMNAAREVGFETVEPLNVETLHAMVEVRDMCATDKCDAYGKNWSCPPACGTLDELQEHLIDAASALSGSGPAYLYVLLEALADGAVACGIPRDKALKYAAETMAGVAEMYLQTKTHPGALKDAVCSPGGSTIAGIRVLEERGFRGAAMDCVIAAYHRNQELGKQ